MGLKMKKAMLSQPIAGKTEEEIVATRERAIAALEAKGYEIVNTLFTDEWYSHDAMQQRGVVQIPLCFLAKSLENMSLCHAAYFCKGWENARGCRAEHDVAKAYGLEILYEEPIYANAELRMKVREMFKYVELVSVSNTKELQVTVSPRRFLFTALRWLTLGIGVDIEYDGIEYKSLIATDIEYGSFERLSLPKDRDILLKCVYREAEVVK